MELLGVRSLVEPDALVPAQRVLGAFEHEPFGRRLAHGLCGLLCETGALLLGLVLRFCLRRGDGGLGGGSLRFGGHRLCLGACVGQLDRLVVLARRAISIPFP